MRRLLPLLSAESAARARLVSGAALLILAFGAANVAVNALRPGSEILTEVFSRWGQLAIVGAATALAALGRRHRPAGGRALIAALLAWSAGAAIWAVAYYSLEAPPEFSWADPPWVLFYPLAYLALGLRLRATLRDMPASVWLDGLVGAFTVAALGTAFIVAPMLADDATSVAAVIAGALYPMADLLLVALVVGIMGLYSWRPGRSWSLLALGFSLFAAADTAYLYRLALGQPPTSSWLDSLLVAGLAVIGFASWQPERAPAARFGAWHVLAIPSAFGAVALALLVVAGVGDLPPLSVGLAAAAVAVSMVRTALTLREIRALAETRRQAVTDELTGLGNRRAFHAGLRERLAAARTQGAPLALLLIDLDSFKEFNDTLGHAAGDRVLAEVGGRLRAAIGADALLARLGGDEFGALLADGPAAEAAAARIAAELGRRLSLEGIEADLSASIGIAVHPADGADAETLLQRADVAMYQAKAARSGHALYDPERDHHTRDRLQMVGELRDAVRDRRLLLHYQPKIALPDGRVTGVEALVRWPHPDRGLVPPAVFVPLAERTGVIRELTAFVLDEALRQRAAWARDGIALGMAVNVSATNLLEPGWTRAVLAALARHEVPPGALTLELTEDVLLSDPDGALAVMDALATAGVRLAIDDFGTGYSSLAYLRRLRVQELKLDRAFIRHLATEAADEAIVEATVGLARRLGLDLIAEGVEDGDALELLAAYGVTGVQGFHVARPMAPDVAEEWLRGWPGLPLPAVAPAGFRATLSA
jgi:diguanylate cyclase (GGDEF)-like protein